MKISEIIGSLQCRPLTPLFEDKEIKTAYTSDLLSDVMGNAPEDSALITIQAHKNTVAVASLKDLPLIIICHDRTVPEDMLQSAEKEEIVLAVTSDSQYTVSWKLHQIIGS